MKKIKQSLFSNMLCIKYSHEQLKKDQMVYTFRVFISSCCDCMVVFVPSKSVWKKHYMGIKYSKINRNRIGWNSKWSKWKTWAVFNQQYALYYVPDCSKKIKLLISSEYKLILFWLYCTYIKITIRTRNHMLAK